MRSIKSFTAMAALAASTAACASDKPAHDQIAATADPTKTIVISSLTQDPKDWDRLGQRFDAVKASGTCKVSPMQEPDYDCFKKEIKRGLTARHN